MDHPRPWLRYVDAEDLDEKTIKFDGLDVDSVSGEKLGKIEGFIVDVNSGRPYHVVVGSGGWFKHKHFLLPIGHVALSDTNTKLIADVTKDRVERFPGFDKDEFEKLSDEDLNGMSDTITAACCPTPAGEAKVVAISSWETTHYAYPTWWQENYYHAGRADRAGMDAKGATGAGMTSRDEQRMRNDHGQPREQVMAKDRVGDVSPHVGGRAQPGDVLGVETGGERTSVGDTSEDENTRRRDAEEAAPKEK